MLQIMFIVNVCFWFQQLFLHTRVLMKGKMCIFNVDKCSYFYNPSTLLSAVIGISLTVFVCLATRRRATGHMFPVTGRL